MQFDMEVRNPRSESGMVSLGVRRAPAGLQLLAPTSDVKTMNAVSKNRHVSTWMLIACGVWLVGLGLYFIVLRPPLLPEDPRFMGTTLAQIRTAVPGLESWLQKCSPSWAALWQVLVCSPCSLPP